MALESKNEAWNRAPPIFLQFQGIFDWKIMGSLCQQKFLPPLKKRPLAHGLHIQTYLPSHHTFFLWFYHKIQIWKNQPSFLLYFLSSVHFPQRRYPYRNVRVRKGTGHFSYISFLLFTFSSVDIHTGMYGYGKVLDRTLCVISSENLRKKLYQCSWAFHEQIKLIQKSISLTMNPVTVVYDSLHLKNWYR